MILWLAMQAMVPPLPRDYPVGHDVPVVAWSCKMIDASGRTFDISGKTPSFVATESRNAEKPMLEFRSANTILFGKQRVSYSSGGSDTAAFSVSLAASTDEKSYSMTLFVRKTGGGLATVHTRVPATGVDGDYATGICQSDFGKPS